MPKLTEEDLKRFPFDNIVWTDETPSHYIGRCPFCGDSKSHINKGHLYISKRSPVFICHRCGCSGNIKEIEDLLNEKCKVSFDGSYSISCNEYDPKSISESIKNSVDSKYNRIGLEELRYLYTRCNLTMDEDEAKKLFRVVSENVVKNKFKDDNTYSKNMLLDRTWFVSAMGTIYIGRAIYDNPLRYTKLEIKNEWSSDIIVDSYMINNYENIKSPETLVVAEGIFDIIPIYLNYKKYHLPKDAIYSACLGIFYNRSEKTFQNLFSSKPKTIEVFCDKGVSKSMLLDQFRGKPKYQKITVHVPMIKDWNEAGPAKMVYPI